MTEDTRTGAAPTPTGPLSKIDYSERIPNNVNLNDDRRLQRALEAWQPKFLDWWKTLGPGLPGRDHAVAADLRELHAEVLHELAGDVAVEEWFGHPRSMAALARRTPGGPEIVDKVLSCSQEKCRT